jgi:hypothetical protein
MVLCTNVWDWTRLWSAYITSSFLICGNPPYFTTLCNRSRSNQQTCNLSGRWTIRDAPKKKGLSYADVEQQNI